MTANALQGGQTAGKVRVLLKLKQTYQPVVPPLTDKQQHNPILIHSLPQVVFGLIPHTADQLHWMVWIIPHGAGLELKTDTRPLLATLCGVMVVLIGTHLTKDLLVIAGSCPVWKIWAIRIQTW